MLPPMKRSGVDGSRPTILKLSTFLASVLVLSATISPPLAAEESVGEKIKKIFSTPTPTPTPHKRKKSTTAKKESASPSPTSLPKKKSVSPPPRPTPSLSSTATATPEKGKRGAPDATLSPEAITGFENYPPKVQQLLNSALEL